MLKTIKKKFGEKVKIYRNAKGLTQNQLALLCGCSGQTISGIETGYAFPSSKNLFKIATALEVPLVYLFNFGEDENIQKQEILSLISGAFDKLNKDEQNVILKVVQELANK